MAEPSAPPQDEPTADSRLAGLRQWRAWLWFVTLAVLLAAPAAVMAFSLAGWRVPYPHFYVNADALYLSALDIDLHHGGSIGDWYLTPAPYLFPDFGLVWAAARVTGSALDSERLVGVVQVLLLVVGLHLYWSRSLGHRAAAVGASATGFLLVTASVVGFLPVSYLTLNGYHVGAVLIGVGCAALVVRLLEPGCSGWRAAALGAVLGVVVVLGNLSDQLLLPLFVLPVVVAVGLLWLWGLLPFIRAAALVALLAVTALAGLALYRPLVAHDTRYRTAYNTHRISQNLHDLAQLVRVQLHQHPLTVVAVALGMAMAAAVLLAAPRWWRVLADRRRLALMLWSMWFVLAAVLLVASQALPATGPPVADRYLTVIPVMAVASLLFVPLSMADLVRAGTWPAAVRVAVGVALVAVTALVSVRTVAHERSGAGLITGRQEQASCVAAAVAHAPAPTGLSWYWATKPIFVLTGGAVVSGSARADFSPQLWILDRRWFNGSVGFVFSGPAPNGWTRKQVEQRLGPVRTTANCGGLTVYVLQQAAPVPRS